ncbi:MAG: hypothetical protein WCK89_19320 [bacterium]
MAKMFKAALHQSGGAKRNYIAHPALFLRHPPAGENQVNLRTIQEVLGHTSPKTTALYTHVTNTSLVEVRQALDSLLE